ncbi:site-specific integrase (plasmid) [Deinococcus taeanensis]|uniref:site-specific integrase n=1 Tax=Deinococcus taeanensis TaxID=2737050 RepID=UPI001CDD2F95|nr:site-specific integrase [Deinococcus taeanensis]UBV44809.1 site-specific integrase [Deinococcus taeanensis]
MDHCKKTHPRWYALFYLALTTGMRRGELLGLRWQDLGLESGEVRIRQSLVQSGSRAVLNEPKTSASRRRILLSADTIDVLRAHQTRQGQELSRWKARSPIEMDLVFPSTVGRFQLPSILVKIFHRLVREAGLPDIRIHDLRHTCASLLVRQGVPIKAVAERLGHQDASLTMRVYTHVYDDQRRAAALSLDDLLSL